MATTDFTNLITLTDAVWFDDVDKAAYAYLTGVSGTNTITATGPASLGAYAVGQKFHFLPANTNSGATTINITQSGAAALGAKNVFSSGSACTGGELVAGIPVILIYDGTQFNVIGGGTSVAPFVDSAALVKGSADATKKVRIEVDGLTTATTRVITMPDRDTGIGEIVLGTLSTGTTPATIDFTISAGAKAVDICFSVHSTNGTSINMIQLGDAGGIEVSGYTGGGSSILAATASANGAGFRIGSDTGAANTYTGIARLVLMDNATNQWAFSAQWARDDAAPLVGSGVKSLTQTLTTVRWTTVAGVDTRDGGTINVITHF